MLWVLIKSTAVKLIREASMGTFNDYIHVPTKMFYWRNKKKYDQIVLLNKSSELLLAKVFKLFEDNFFILSWTKDAYLFFFFCSFQYLYILE